MNLRRRTVLGAAGASLLAAPALGPALARDYPNKPLKMIVPYPPGGGTDGLGRITAQFLSEKLGQQIVIQNIGGASSTIGSRDGPPRRARRLHHPVQRQPVRAGQDGGPLLPSDPQTDFRAIAQAGEAPLVLLANNNVRATLRGHHGGRESGSQEVLRGDLLGRLGRTHRDLGLAEAHRHPARPDPLQGHGAGQCRPDVGQRPVLHGSLDGAAAARHVGPRRGHVRDLEGAHAARAEHSDERRGRPEGLQPELLVRRLGAQGHARARS